MAASSTKGGAAATVRMPEEAGVGSQKNICARHDNACECRECQTTPRKSRRNVRRLRRNICARAIRVIQCQKRLRRKTSQRVEAPPVPEKRAVRVIQCQKRLRRKNLTEGRSTASGPGERLRQSMPSSSSESIASVFVQITDTAFEGITHV